MSLEALCGVLGTNDGSLPDINFDFGDARVVGDVYALIQHRSTGMLDSWYWSKLQERDLPIRFGDNPALAFLAGDADPFHVVFSGVASRSGRSLPLLGVFVLGNGEVSLDYRMGPEWDETAIVGLFELISEISALSTSVIIAHTGNVFDHDGRILLAAYEEWVNLNPPADGA